MVFLEYFSDFQGDRGDKLMCLIIHKKKGVELPGYVLDDMLTYNTDGWGVMWYNPRKRGAHKVATKKGFQRQPLLDLITKLGDVEILVHGRQRTHGVVSINNNHPFELGQSGVWMMHNGVIPRLSHGTYSDTALFADRLTDLIEVNPEVVLTEGFRFLVERVMGNSRLAFMLPTGQVQIITDKPWIEYHGLKMSNDYAWSLHGNWKYKRTSNVASTWTSRPAKTYENGGSQSATANPTTTQIPEPGGILTGQKTGGKVYPYYSSNNTLYSGEVTDFSSEREVAESDNTFPAGDEETLSNALQATVVAGSLLEDGTSRREYSDGTVVYSKNGKIRVTSVAEEKKAEQFHNNILAL